jgi:hypothetical protein
VGEFLTTNYTKGGILTRSSQVAETVRRVGRKKAQKELFAEGALPRAYRRDVGLWKEGPAALCLCG